MTFITSCLLHILELLFRSFLLEVHSLAALLLWVNTLLCQYIPMNVSVCFIRQVSCTSPRRDWRTRSMTSLRSVRVSSIETAMIGIVQSAFFTGRNCAEKQTTVFLVHLNKDHRPRCPDKNQRRHTRRLVYIHSPVARTFFCTLSTGSPAGRTPPHGDGSMYSQANVRAGKVRRPPIRAQPWSWTLKRCCPTF